MELQLIQVKRIPGIKLPAVEKTGLLSLVHLSDGGDEYPQSLDHVHTYVCPKQEYYGEKGEGVLTPDEFYRWVALQGRGMQRRLHSRGNPAAGVLITRRPSFVQDTHFRPWGPSPVLVCVWPYDSFELYARRK